MSRRQLRRDVSKAATTRAGFANLLSNLIPGGRCGSGTKARVESHPEATARIVAEHGPTERLA
jgi:hypothetical protein